MKPSSTLFGRSAKDEGGGTTDRLEDIGAPLAAGGQPTKAGESRQRLGHPMAAAQTLADLNAMVGDAFPVLSRRSVARLRRSLKTTRAG
jgi:hypothetical protein